MPPTRRHELRPAVRRKGLLCQMPLMAIGILLAPPFMLWLTGLVAYVTPKSGLVHWLMR
jgi:hypothetical protein